MNATQYDGQVLHEISGMSINQMVSDFGSPTFLYDASLIRQRCQDLSAFDTVRYAQKACSNLSILALIREQGVLVDAVSAGEAMRALAVGYVAGNHSAGNHSAGGDMAGGPSTGAAPSAGAAPPDIVYTCDIFDREALQLIGEHGFHCNLGSMDMISQLAEVTPECDLTLRINPGFGHGHSQKTNTGGPQSKHGIWHEDLPECKKKCDAAGLRITGLHMHIGSGTDLEHLAQVCQAMEQAARIIGPTVTSISAGGGLPTVYREGQTSIDLAAYYQLWDQIRVRLQQDFGHPIALEIEPGRYLSAESGFLLTEVRAIKRMGENLFYLVDAGFNNLARPILYGAYHPMAICPADGRAIDEFADVIVGGPLCESGDIFTQGEGGVVSRRRLPLARVGDILVIGCTGAYGAVMGSNYNSKPLATEVLIDRGTLKVIRRRQSLEELFAAEREALESLAAIR